MNIELTKDGKKAIACIYKEYLRRKSEGQPKKQAIFFDSHDCSQREFISSIWEDVPELKKAGLIKVFITNCIELSDAGIIYMENKTADTIKEWLTIGGNLIP